MRICFLGTPEFALPSLKMLCEKGYEVAAVFTQPDRPRNRGKKLQAPPVKLLAQELGLPVYQFEKIRTEGVETLRALQVDLMITAAYGQILSQEILDIPPLGCINVHGSLLPKYRGPAPVQWCVINGEKETGVTTMLTARGVDTGDMLLKRATAIGPEETAEELYLRLSELGAEVLFDTLQALEAKTLRPVPQKEAEASYYPMLTKEDGRLHFTEPAAQICDRVRGVQPWPGAYGLIGGQVLKIWRARPAEDRPGEPGQVLVADGKKGLFVKAGEGVVEVLELQAPGGKRMPAQDFLRGKTLPGDRFDGE